jgi:hypothetical protein
MKKILLTCTVALMATFSYAQRVADLTIKLNSPATGAKIRTGTPFNINITLKNNGPDVIKSTDTILHVWSISNQLNPQLFALIPHTSDMAVGDTLNVTIPGNQLQGGNGTSYNLCSFAFLFNAEEPDTVFDNQLNAANNRSCNTINYSGVGIGEIVASKVSAFATSSYPNPANKAMTVTFNANVNETYSVQIMDVQGKVISTIENTASTSGTQEVPVNVSVLNKGIYIYTVNKNGSVSSSKFIVE